MLVQQFLLDTHLSYPDPIPLSLYLQIVDRGKHLFTVDFRLCHIFEVMSVGRDIECVKNDLISESVFRV